ncbi:MAG: argininosuccinate lyase [Candidatus Omnitrophica bacterium]|nr:argininosuccinate lyase [Candidatus Omnitrophota bacterium]
MTKKLWGGRFGKSTDPIVEDFTRSIQYDYKLAECDVLGSIAHVNVLKKCGYLKPGEASKLISGLKWIKAQIATGAFKPDLSVEDIHTQIQNLLEKNVGDVALKLHTARSRNDQVVFATKLYCKFEIAMLQSEIMALAVELLAKAGANKGVIIPGFTHMQHAQPVYLSDYMKAYSVMLTRDSARLNNIFLNIHLTLGAGAIAGTPVEASKYRLKAAEYLKEYCPDSSFDIEPTINSIDSVSDRDFVIEIISGLSILATHLSRLAEDLIIWSTKEFGFVELDDAYCTGSSLMPQKKNADVLELVRGYAGRLYGNLVSVLTMMKALPLSYNRDMQLDKESLFSSFETVSGELRVLKGLVKTLRFNKSRIEEYLKDESLYATDLVYYLVDLGVPFKKAHSLVGGLVKYSMETGIQIKAMPEDALKSRLHGNVSKKEILKRFDPDYSVKMKRSIKR